MATSDFDVFRQSISALVDLSEEEWNLLLSHIRLHTCRKGEYILHEGEVCHGLTFVLKGGVVYCYLDAKGEEVATDFAFEGSWVTDNRSRLGKLPSHLSIKAIEPTDIVQITESSLEQIYLRIPRLERVGRLLIEQAYVRLVQLSLDLQLLSAEERYLKMCREYPLALQRLPLYHIAHYLGIAPKSLSRIRKLTVL